MLKQFRREFSSNFYKNLTFPLGEVSLAKDWVNDKRGDPYPLISSSGAAREAIIPGAYHARNEGNDSCELHRFAFGFFPFATYEIEFDELLGEAGFAFRSRTDGILCHVGIVKAPDGSALTFKVGDRCEKADIENFGSRFVCSARPGAFDIYTGGSTLRYVKTFECKEFAHSNIESIFRTTNAEFYTILPNAGFFKANKICSYMDSGVSQADIRPIRYEDGTPINTDGKIYFTMSVRLQAGTYQSVISWIPSTADFRLEGALFFDTGDGRWCGDVASSIIYNRETNEWLIWYCSFSHGHILAHGKSLADPRHGINIIDATLMDVQTTVSVKASSSDVALGHTSKELSRATVSDDRLFFAKYGDEDPDLIYDKKTGYWYMAICRGVDIDGKHPYRYFLYKSKDPFTGFEYVTHSDIGENTGGSIVKMKDGYHFVCGSDFGNRSRYYMFDINDFTKHEALEFDYDDGGFRGWGTLMWLPCGSRMKLYHMTFDRHNGSDYNWSYGNIYVFSCYD